MSDIFKEIEDKKAEAVDKYGFDGHSFNEENIRDTVYKQVLVNQLLLLRASMRGNPFDKEAQKAYMQTFSLLEHIDKTSKPE